MASRAETAQQFITLQQQAKIDDLIKLLADDVVMVVPMLGTTAGKDEVEKQLRARAGGGGGSNVTWSDPEEEGDDVSMTGTGGQFGPVTMKFTFGAGDQISKIDISIGGNGQRGGMPFEPPPLNMAWAKVPTERPPLPKDLGAEGFTLRMADAGSYGWAPERWPYENDTPRGAWPAEEGRRGLSAPYTIYDKHEVWAESSADLYELAIRERWAPATEVAWGSIEPLEDHIEASLDQVFTHISEQQYNANQVLMGWLKEISYGYHEVKLYLSTQVFDQARHVEAFRKRALSNGGGLGVQQPGFMNRTVYAAFKFTEYVVYVNILRGSFLLGLCEWGDKLGRSQADRELFEHTANDMRRHLAYGVDLLKHYLRHETSSFGRVRTWLDRGEAMMAADMQRDKPTREALILALGDTVAEGKQQLKTMRQHQLQRYLQTLDAASINDRESHLIYQFRDIIENP